MLLTVPERGKVGNILRHVVPVGAAVARDVNQTVVGAGPDHAFLERRLGDGEQDGGVGGAGIVRGEPARSFAAFLCRWW